MHFGERFGVCVLFLSRVFIFSTDGSVALVGGVIPDPARDWLGGGCRLSRWRLEPYMKAFVFLGIGGSDRWSWKVILCWGRLIGGATTPTIVPAAMECG